MEGAALKMLCFAKIILPKVVWREKCIRIAFVLVLKEIQMKKEHIMAMALAILAPLDPFLHMNISQLNFMTGVVKA